MAWPYTLARNTALAVVPSLPSNWFQERPSGVYLIGMPVVPQSQGFRKDCVCGRHRGLRQSIMWALH